MKHVLLLVLLASAALAQQTWIVDKLQRPGFHFADLPEAVAAAAPGDTLRVRGTTPTGPFYSAPVIDGKGLAIVGDDPANRPVTYDVWHVRNIPASQSVVLAHLKIGTLELLSNIPFGHAWCGMVCSNSEGHLSLDGIEHSHGPGCFGSSFFDGFVFVSCRLVTITRSRIWPCNTWIACTDTKLMVSDTLIQGAREQTYPAGYIGSLLASFSEVWLTGTEVVGLDEMHPQPLGNFNNAQPALSLCRSTLYLGGASRLVGGVGSFGRANPIWSPVTLDCNIPVEVHRDPSTQMSGSYPPPHTTDILRHVPALRYAIDARTLTVQQSAEPNSSTLLVAAAVLPAPWVTVAGRVWLDLATMLLADFRVAPPAGDLVRTYAIPPGLPSGTRFGMQAVELLPSTCQLDTTNVLSVGIW